MASIYKVGALKTQPRKQSARFTDEGVRLITALIMIVLAASIARAAFGSTIIDLCAIVDTAFAPRVRSSAYINER